MIVRKIGNVTVYDDFKFSDSMNRVENLRIDLKQTFINQLIFAAMYIGISFFIMRLKKKSLKKYLKFMR